MLMQAEYEVGEELGAGAHGVVRAARQLSTGQPVVIKTIVCSSNNRYQKNEVQVLAALNHPNVVRCVGCQRQIMGYGVGFGMPDFGTWSEALVWLTLGFEVRL